MKIAKEDIPCYKIVFAVGIDYMKESKPTFYRTAFRWSYVEEGEIYSSELKVEKLYLLMGRTARMIEIGLHSVINKDDIKRIFANTKSRFLAECIIPKGACYYEGEFDDIPSYASDELKYVKIEKLCV